MPDASPKNPSKIFIKLEKVSLGKFTTIKKVIKILVSAGLLLISLAIVLTAPINRTPLSDQPFYSEMSKDLNKVSVNKTSSSNLKSSWAAINITPNYEMPMAGYKPRDHYDSVHDSLFARMLLLKSDNQNIVLLNIDLLIFPPALKKAIQIKLQENQFNAFLYLSATHTHNGLGGWDSSLLGKVVSGTYHEEWIDAVSEKIAQAIINQSPIISSINYWESDAQELVVNRIAYSNGEKDGKIRGIQIKRSDSTKALLFTFSAHPTSITKKSLALSADYPSVTIEHIENDFNFGMFMGGMVGSHSFINFDEQNFELIKTEGKLIHDKIQSANYFKTQKDITTSFTHVPIAFGPSQLRIGDNWKVRDWVLSSLFGGLKGELTYLRLGDIIMIGTPCDFSGEIYVKENLEAFAKQYDKHLIITSFNGNYIGYITYDGHYDTIKNAETRELNWVGPYYGEYFSTMIKKLIEKDSTTF